jgi:hypothetical protein
MSMQGSLKDVGIGELIQFPTQSRRTGRMVIERDGRRAELYYQNGELHHAVLGERIGFPVLVEILPWTRGTFVFEVDVPPPVRTIEMDLGKAMIKATLEGDEAPAEAEPAGPSVQSTVGFSSVFGPKWDPQVFARLSTFLAEHPLFFYSSVMLRRGTVLAEFFRPVGDLEESTQTYMLLKDIMKHYAYACQGKMLVDSSYCTVAVQAFSGDRVLLALARPDARPYDVEVALDGLVLKLEDPFTV